MISFYSDSKFPKRKQRRSFSRARVNYAFGRIYFCLLLSPYKTYVTKMNTDISFQQQKLIEICEAIHNSIFTEFFCHTLSLLGRHSSNCYIIKQQSDMVVQRLIKFSINRDYDRSVRFTILWFHVSILVRFLHTFSSVPLVSYYIVKLESRTL